MIFEDLEIIWRDEKSHPSHTLDDEALRGLVVDRANKYQQKIFWRDASDIGIHGFTALLLFGVCIWGMQRKGGAFLQDMGPLLCIGAGYVFVSVFRLVGRLRQKCRENKFDDSISGNLKKLVANAEYQIGLQKKYNWWYIVPVVPGYMLLAASYWSAGPEPFWFMTITLSVVFGSVVWGNNHSIRTVLIPQKEELEKLLGDLANGGKSAEIRCTVPEVPQVPLGRRCFGFGLAALIFGLVGWFLAANFWPAEKLQDPEFDDISSFAESDKAKIDTWLQDTVERSQYPSLSVAIVKDGSVVYQGIFGYENTWTDRIATTNTAYHVASVTKAFTATLAVVLHERGIVDLDAPVAKYLPEEVEISDTPERGAKITLRQLASHTSGLPRSVPGTVQSVEWRYELEPERLYGLLADVTLESEPGTSGRYSNLGFGLLGHALALAGKKSLNELLQEYVCAPLNLERSAIHVDPDLKFATGYTTPPRLPERHSYKRRMAGSGGLVTSLADLSKFLTAHMKAGVFTTNLLAEMHSPTKLNNGSEVHQALGWSIDANNPSGLILSKNGGRKNCGAWIGFSPGHGIGVAVMTNIGSPDVDPIGRWLLARSVPGGARPASEHGAAKVAPFSGIRWENDQPIVLVEGRWSKLVSIDDIPIGRILEFARQEHKDRAQMRFGEDLPELLFAMDHVLQWDVTLGLEKEDGRIERVEIRMTEANRELVRDARLDTE